MDSANNSTLRILCHSVEVDGQLWQRPHMPLITVDTGTATAAITEFRGVETHSTIFVNGTVHIQHHQNGRLAHITDSDGNKLFK